MIIANDNLDIVEDTPVVVFHDHGYGSEVFVRGAPSFDDTWRAFNQDELLKADQYASDLRSWYGFDSEYIPPAPEWMSGR